MGPQITQKDKFFYEKHRFVDKKGRLLTQPLPNLAIYRI